MKTDDRHYCILFADICDSMPLYEESGDASALAVIAECLDALAAQASRYGGTVIRSKGDDLLCIFEAPTRALDAAAAMVAEHGVDTPAVHVGIHSGPVIRARQDIYGDAVNVAARMLALAKPGEIVVSKDVVDALPVAERSRLAALGRRAIKGKQDAMEIFSMVLDEGDATQVVWNRAGQSEDAPPETLILPVAVELAYQGQTATVHDGERCLIGRADRCDLVIANPRVSREHAWVAAIGGRATLTDHSSSGSWIVRPEGTHVTLRRESAALRGRGVIRLGLHPRHPQSTPEIEFWLRVVM